MLPNLHIIGIQGSGKGTQAALLEKNYGLTVLASGNLFRKRAEVGDEFAQDIIAKLRTGNLFPDNDVLRIVEDFFASHTVSKGLLGDGVIRTVSQYELFEPIWSAHGLEAPFLIHLRLDDAIARERIEKRNNEEKIDRYDNTPEAIERRITTYHKSTEPVIDYFKRLQRVIAVDSAQPIDKVYADIEASLQTYFPALKPV